MLKQTKGSDKAKLR